MNAAAEKDIRSALVKAEKERDAAVEQWHKDQATVDELTNSVVDLTRERDEERAAHDNASAAILMIASELSNDPKMAPDDQGDPRWTPALAEARKVRTDRDEARRRADLSVDCGQEDVCATPPGCGRHWAQRNQELVEERDAALKDRDEAIARADGDRAQVRKWRDAYWQLAAELSIVTTPETGAADLVRAIVERVLEAEKERDHASGMYERILESRDKAEQDSDRYAARVAELEGIRPELPPRPPQGSGLPRYGLRWNGPETPLSVPMADGYWTPYHLAVGKVAELEGALVEESEKAAQFGAQASIHGGDLNRASERIMELEGALDAWRALRQTPPVNGSGSTSEWTRAYMRAEGLLDRAAAPPEQAPGMETCARDVWRCSGCGEMLDNPPGTAWRWNGKAWEHRCPERDPQAGYEPAKNFGPRVAPEQAPRTDDGALPCSECAHSERCKFLLGPSYRTAGPCDWDPSRFQPARPADVGAARHEKTPAPFDILAHLTHHREWSERTFGPGHRSAGLIDHIRKELEEIERAPDDLTEWIDVVILALDGAWRSGHSPAEIIAALVAKQAKNERRRWPDWRTAAPGKTIEHVRDASGAAPAASTGTAPSDPEQIRRDQEGRRLADMAERAAESLGRTCETCRHWTWGGGIAGACLADALRSAHPGDACLTWAARSESVAPGAGESEGTR